MFCLANCCRLCLCKNNTVVELSCSTSDNLSYFKKLMDFAPQLVIDPETYYPTGICEKCQKQVNKVHSFIQECLEAKKKLTTYINKLIHATIDMETHKLIDGCIDETHAFAEVLIPSSTSNTIYLENRPIKEEIDIEENSLELPEFVTSVIDDASQNALLETTKTISFDPCVKQEFVSDSELHNTELIFTTVSNEPHEITSDKIESIPYNKEKNQFYMEGDGLQSDESVSSAEFEPVRKNEKTPRLKRYKCLKCVKKFSRYSHLLRHSRVHTGNRPFPCTTCNRSFSQLENLERHQLIHSDIKPHACTQCDKTFRDKSYLKKHIQLHEGIRYTCDICNKTYTNSRNLIVHKRKHTGERPFECSICNNKYANCDTLRKHTKKCVIKRNIIQEPCPKPVLKHTDKKASQANEII